MLQVWIWPAEISLNLGILNLTAVSDSRWRTDFAAADRERAAPRHQHRVKERIYQAAFVVLVMFFAFVIFNDVTKLPMFTHLKP